MTREQQLGYCKVCTNRTFNIQFGIVCGITNQPADFNPTCPNFSLQAGATEPLPADLQRYMDTSINVNLAMASSGQRFANYIIDTIMVYIVVFTLAILVTIITAFISPAEVESIDENSASFTLFGYLVAILGMVSYYMFMEAVFGRTIGKLITGTRVVTKDGSIPGTYTIFLRSLSRLVPFEAFSFLGGVPRGWHDSWTDTWVIRNKPH
jgi:uncharacterized RDD family membrane protein YckC